MTALRVYIAAAYQARDAVRLYADELEQAGMVCTSSWLKETHEVTSGTSGAAIDLTDDAVRAHCRADFKDISRADVLVLLTESATGHRGGGGRHVETGYAIALDIPVLVVGMPENVFHRGACEQVDDWHGALIRLVRYERDRARATPQEVLAG